MDNGFEPCVFHFVKMKKCFKPVLEIFLCKMRKTLPNCFIFVNVKTFQKCIFHFTNLTSFQNDRTSFHEVNMQTYLPSRMCWKDLQYHDNNIRLFIQNVGEQLLKRELNFVIHDRCFILQKLNMSWSMPSDRLFSYKMTVGIIK